MNSLAQHTILTPYISKYLLPLIISALPRLETKTCRNILQETIFTIRAVNKKINEKKNINGKDLPPSLVNLTANTQKMISFWSGLWKPVAVCRSPSDLMPLVIVDHQFIL